MNRKRICIIYNFAQHYRTNIFQLLDKEFDCSFYFGKNYLDVKKMDYSLLKGNIHEVSTIKFGPLIYRRGIIKLLLMKYDAYIILGESRVLSTWLFLLLSRLLPNKKVFTWSHGWYGKEKGIVKFLNKLLLNLPNCGNFFYGNYGRELAIKEGIDPSKQYTIHNSLAYDEQIKIRKRLKEEPIYRDHFGNENPNLIFVGRLTKVKRLDLLIIALKICKDRGEKFNLTLIGSGLMADNLKSMVLDIGLQDNVWFYGASYDESVLARLIYNADLCISPGNVGLTAMHSMTFGCPVITHNKFSYQMPEFEAITPYETGNFFEYENVESLAYIISDWFRKKGSNRKEIRDACIKEIDTSWNPYFQLDVFKKVLNDKIY